LHRLRSALDGSREGKRASADGEVAAACDLHRRGLELGDGRELFEECEDGVATLMDLLVGRHPHGVFREQAGCASEIPS
jgi:hypothetical protein